MKISKRSEKIVQLCKNKTVLDIGCIDHKASTEKSEGWVHKRIKRVASSLKGLDYEAKEVEKLRKKGYNIVYGDAENFDLQEKFDVIVCGELIEHLLNVGNFLDCVRKHMHKDSILILTTPNAFATRRIVGSIIKGRLNENKEHVAYYSDTTIYQLLRRKNFRNITIEYLESWDNNNMRLFLERILNKIMRNNNNMVLFVTCTF